MSLARRRTTRSPTLGERIVADSAGARRAAFSVAFGELTLHAAGAPDRRGC